METVFSKIIAGEIPTHKVYEDEQTLAFLDINPVNHGHTLVVPKVHATNIFDVPPETLARLVTVGQQIAKAQHEVLGCDGVNMVMNNGEAAGQEVPHIHLHVIPRHAGDGSALGFHHTTYDSSEAAARVAATLATALA